MHDSIDRFLAEWKRQNLPLPALNPRVGCIYRIARASRILGRRLDSTCAEHGITRSQYEALAALRRKYPEPMSAQEIMDASFLTSGSVTAMINQLLAAGLVRREIDDGDRRRVLIALTRAGMKTIERAIGDRVDDNARLAKLLPANEQDELNRLLRKLLAAMERLDAEATA